LERTTEGVRILTGEPEKAIVKLSIPMMIGMLLQTIYNLADAIWISGLGHEALSAIGIFFPIFMGIVSLSSGLSIGVSSAISRRIGAKNRESANRCASYGLSLSLILGISITLLLLATMEKIIDLMSVEDLVASLTMIYSKIIISGSIFLVLSMMLGGVLRGEGDAKRSTYALAFGSILNIILDPIFIYLLDLRIAGAAYATVLSMILSNVLLLYWLFGKKDSFIEISFIKLSLDRDLREIFRVGVPSSASQLLMSIAMFVLNTLILSVGGEEGIAIFTTSWRVITFGIVPLFGMASATTAVTGAFYGARDADKLGKAYFYSIKLSFIIGLLVSSIIIIFAPQISQLFTYSIESQSFYRELISSMRILAFFLPTAPLGIMTASMFQGIGKGERALLVTIFRALILQLAFAYLLIRLFPLGLMSVWFGIVLGNAFAAFLAFFWGFLTIRSLKRAFRKYSEISE
jgi:putative MATE family efflux protein